MRALPDSPRSGAVSATKSLDRSSGSGATTAALHASWDPRRDYPADTLSCLERREPHDFRIRPRAGGGCLPLNEVRCVRPQDSTTRDTRAMGIYGFRQTSGWQQLGLCWKDGPYGRPDSRNHELGTSGHCATALGRSRPPSAPSIDLLGSLRSKESPAQQGHQRGAIAYLGTPSERTPRLGSRVARSGWTRRRCARARSRRVEAGAEGPLSWLCRREGLVVMTANRRIERSAAYSAWVGHGSRKRGL
ncbi:UNVERIFIED_ORG: hypothetical protein ABIB19_000165 [Arthrobacter sp. UYEF10]